MRIPMTLIDNRTCEFTYLLPPVNTYSQNKMKIVSFTHQPELDIQWIKKINILSENYSAASTRST